MVTKTSPIGVPIASFSDQPVIFCATGLRMVTRPSASVAMTASPMLLIVTRRRASLRSPVRRAACSRTSASSSSSAALTRRRSASSRSCSRRSRMAPASRSPLARSLNSVTRDVQGAIGSPRASARAALTAATWARTMRQRTRTAISSPAPAVRIPTVTRSCSDCRVGWSTAEAGSPMAMIQPVSGERLHAENDGIPSRSVERTAPSARARDGPGEVRARAAADELLLGARARDDRHARVDDRDDAVHWSVLLAEHGAEHRCQDAHAEHVANLLAARLLGRQSRRNTGQLSGSWTSDDTAGRFVCSTARTQSSLTSADGEPSGTAVLTMT